MLGFEFQLSGAEKVLWAIQVFLIIGWLILPRFRGIPGEAPLTAGLAALGLAWAFRLAGLFLLTADGYYFLGSDDPCRFGMAHGWSLHPFLVTWDGIWLGGVFYFHGMAMRFLEDPLIASKLVAVGFSGLPLAGIFLLARGLYRNNRIAAASVLTAGPLWYHLLLSTGTMAEMPMLGGTLAGAGLLLMGLDIPSGPRRIAVLASSALAFVFGTMFHTVAWLNLAPILGALCLFALLRRGKDSLGIGTALAFSLVAVAYCIFWVASCWIKFGDPLQFIRGQIAHNRAVVGGWGDIQQYFTYPVALGYALWPIAPITVFGIIMAFLPGSNRRRVLTVLGVLSVAMLILVATTGPGGAATVPYRAVSAIAATLIPIALAPFFCSRLSHDAPRNFGIGSGLRLGLFIGLLSLWFGANFTLALKRKYDDTTPNPDSVALGVWLRQEHRAKRTLFSDEGSRNHPVRLWIPEPSMQLDRETIQFVYGHPHQLDLRGAGYPSPEIESLATAQALITVTPIEDARLRFVTRVGMYHIYVREP